MFQFLRGVALIAAVISNCGVALAEPDRNSANYIMPGCQAHIAMVDHKPFDSSSTGFFEQGYCMGTIQGIFYQLNLCPSGAVTHTQMIRVVVKYIDDRPARLNEEFDGLAAEALLAAWPCKK